MSSERLDWQRLLQEALTVEGSIRGVYDRFHDYSLANVLFFHAQGIHEPVASFSRWKTLGRHVVRGAQAKQVIVPVLVNEPLPPGEPAEPAVDEKRERVARLIGFKLVRAVFALSDTDGPAIPPRPTPGWEYQQALSTLGIREVPFEQTNGNIQGYSRGVEVAINPVAVNPTKTRFHELGHIVLGHTLAHGLGDKDYHRGIREFQAEATAYLCLNELGQLDDDTARVSRGYIQHWLDSETPPDKAIQQVFTAADRILRAGRLSV